MPRTLKVIAITGKAHCAWKVLVEIDRDTIHRLTQVYPDSSPPEVGTEIDLGDAIDRASDLQSRERKLKDFCTLLAEFTPKPKANETDAS